jgi:hypothetical protein
MTADDHTSHTTGNAAEEREEAWDDELRERLGTASDSKERPGSSRDSAEAARP